MVIYRTPDMYMELPLYMYSTCLSR